MNQVTLSGRLTRDPELTYNNATGNAMVRFSVAVDKKLSREKKQEMESRNQPTADFINCVCWGKLAETVNTFTEKGKRVLVDGRLQTGSYKAKDGTRRYTTDVFVNSIEFIDWKERESEDVAKPQQNTSNSFTSAAQPHQDGFFDNGFIPMVDDRIPF